MARGWVCEVVAYSILLIIVYAFGAFMILAIIQMYYDVHVENRCACSVANCDGPVEFMASYPMIFGRFNDGYMFYDYRCKKVQYGSKDNREVGGLKVISDHSDSSCSTAVVNAPDPYPTDRGCERSGAAYVFRAVNGSWTPAAYLKAPNNNLNNDFGSTDPAAGSRKSAAGSIVVVGAPGESSCSREVVNGAGPYPNDVGCTSAGAAYVFSDGSGVWAAVAYLKAPSASNQDLFGTSVWTDGEQIRVECAKDRCLPVTFELAGDSWGRLLPDGSLAVAPPSPPSPPPAPPALPLPPSPPPPSPDIGGVVVGSMTGLIFIVTLIGCISKHLWPPACKRRCPYAIGILICILIASTLAWSIIGVGFLTTLVGMLFLFVWVPLSCVPLFFCWKECKPRSAKAIEMVPLESDQDAGFVEADGDEEANGIDATGRSDIGGGGEAELSGSRPSPPEVHLPTSNDGSVLPLSPTSRFVAELRAVLPPALKSAVQAESKRLAAESKKPSFESKKPSFSAEQSATCAIGALRAAGPPELMGSGFCVDGTRRLICSCAHVWNAAADNYKYEAKPGSFLDPSVHGVAIGFSSGSGLRIDWTCGGRAMLRRKVDPPGLDLAILWMTQTPDGTALPEDHAIKALGLGSANALRPRDDLTILGFPRAAAKTSEIARPVFGKFSVIDWEGGERADGPWINLGGAPPEHPGHSGGPVLNAKNQVVGWCVRSQQARALLKPAPIPETKVVVATATELRPVESLEPLLAEVLIELELDECRSWRQLVELEDVAAVLEDPELRGDELRKRLTNPME